MHNYKLVIEYDGTDYFGWQRQKPGSGGKTERTVQETIERSLKKITGESLRLAAAGRTDTGVHALGQTANFKTDSAFDINKLRHSLNAVLPESITIRKLSEAREDFHARYSAKKKEYIYQITTCKRSINSAYFLQINYELDFKLMEKALGLFVGNKSFKSLCKNKTDKHNFHCIISHFSYIHRTKRNEIVFKIIGNRFLHSMIRALIGCIIDIGRGKSTLQEVKEKFIKGENIKTAYLPAKGLILKKIYY